MFVPPVAKSKTVPPQRSIVVAQEPDQAHILQRSVGNQAMQRFWTQPSAATPNEPDPQLPAATVRIAAQEAAPSGSFAEIPVFSSGHAERFQMPPHLLAPDLLGTIQAKLEFGAIDDPLEDEADHVADQVMRMPDPHPSTRTLPLRLSRKGSPGERSAARIERSQDTGSSQAAVGDTLGVVREVLRSPGQPVDPALRAFFEPRFGYDFSRTRVHADARAAESARAVNALAYTVGSDVVFGHGAFAPQTHSGKRLLAHELAHVVQQSGGAGFAPAGRLERNAGASESREENRDRSRANVGIKGWRPGLVQASTTGLRLQRVPADPLVTALGAKLNAVPRDLAGFYGALSALNASRAGDAVIRAGLNSFLAAGKLSSAEAFRAVALQEIGPDRTWPLPVRNFAEGLDSGTFAIAGLAPAGADTLRAFAVEQAGTAAEGSADALVVYVHKFDSLWDGATYAALVTVFDNTLDSKGPRNRRARKIFQDLYATAATKAAYDTDTPAGFRALCDTHEAPDSINDIASQRLQKLRALLNPPAVVAAGAADPLYTALVATVTPAAQALDARDHQEIGRSHTWRLAVEAKVSGTTAIVTQTLHDDLWSVITSARAAAPVAAPAGPAAAEPIPATNAAQKAWLGTISIAAPASPQNASTADFALPFQVRSTVPNPALAVRRRVVVEPAAQVSDGQQDERLWPDTATQLDHTAHVNPDAGAVGATVFKARLTMPPLPVAQFGEKSADVTVNDKRLDWFKATIDPGITFMRENARIGLAAGNTVNFFGGQFPITVRPQLGPPGGATTANPNLAIFMDGAIKRSGVVLNAIPRAQFDMSAASSPLFNTILTEPVPPPPAAGDPMEVSVNYYAGAALAPAIKTQTVAFKLAGSLPVAAGADAALIAADNTELNKPIATAGTLLNFMSTVGPVGSPERAVAAAVAAGTIKVAATIVRSDSLAKVIAGHGTPTTQVAYAMGTVDAVGVFTHTLIAQPGAAGWRWPAIPGTVFLNLTPDTHTPAAKRANAQMSELLAHEGIHAADLIGPDEFDRYATEFRAYWVMGVGAGDSTAPDTTMSNLGPKSPRANRIFRHVYGSQTYPFVKPAYDSNTNRFRERVDNLLHPDGINLTLSRPLADLRAEIESYVSSAAAYPAKKAAVVAKYGVCTADDRREITGNRAWRDLVESKFTKALIVVAAPPTSEQAEIKTLLAIP